MASAPPVTPTPPPSSTPRAPSSLYALQVRAFLEAADAVDADPDVIEDLLDGFPVDESLNPEDLQDGDPAGDADADAGGAAGAGHAPTAAARDQGHAEGGSDEDSDAGGDIAHELAAYIDEAQTAWTAPEIKQMKHVLKEQGMTPFVNEYVIRRGVPIPKLLYAFGVCLCKELRQKQHRTMLYFLRVALSRELESRERLQTYNTVDDAVHLIRASKRILILTGAGISVSCGIPDFRSRNGLYASLQDSGEYELDDPQQMFDIQFFRENPAGKLCTVVVANKIYPSNFIPSPCHRFIKLVEDKGKLLRNYTQNIDTLETLVGVKRVVQCHGSFATASCVNCRIEVPGSEIAEEIMSQRVPLCKVCNVPQPVPPAKAGKKGRRRKTKNGWDSDASDEPEPPPYPPGVMKPGITFFGEGLDDVFSRSLMEDRAQVDLVIIIGTSLKVSPVSDTISHLPHSVPQILINKTPVKHINPDIVLLGNADDVVQHLCRRLNWDLPAALPNASGLEPPRPNLRKRPSADFDPEPRRVGSSYVWLFEGAEGGRWADDVEKKYPALGPETASASRSHPSAGSHQATDHQVKKARIQ
ncbi:SIR2-domain-containing protein [Epithele typhae]|uniref:SIR2-domain-containing protein n=1 Tax=Epithele typhae TaxID=378194 RepID=UPI002007AD9E|nr:SIR2-domain-containing protein [Epithele typhae]KAH9940872.1 SIR2-domain-containing protein [Epithele typhae]